ncbi:MAG: hypothetical protein QOH49_3334 [Acidobacteriota bacterium]|jgi:hypothetical protein|nr:hypothetical protein [Acidobacteriota bacterium]
MAERKVTLVADEGIFKGLSKQNMLFHQCMGELVDNAIAAKKNTEKFRVDVVFRQGEDQYTFELYIADNGRGMSSEILERALQLGRSATTESRLNEHGFGLKNALATLSGGNGYWKLWTKHQTEDTVFSVQGPFKSEMIVRDDDPFPTDDFLPVDFSTLIRVPVKLSLIQTVQGRGAPAKDLNTLREWLLEHLGVLYRGYLLPDRKTYDTDGVIAVSIGNDTVSVTPVEVPLGSAQTKYFDVELGGIVQHLTYTFGTLDKVKRSELVRGKGAKYYYQGNIPSQGIDIRLGKRVIATRLFDTIWKTEDRQKGLDRHNRYNDFLGELIIPELPRGVLTTVNNKTDFNFDDPDWDKIFNILNEIPPAENIREKSEARLKRNWMNMLKATNPDDEVSDEKHVWPTGTRIDVYRRTSDGKEIIYELKVGKGAPEHLYQLKMYWDGLVLSGRHFPKEAILLVEDFNTTLEEMANMMNKLPPPETSKPYNFKIEKLKDKGL